MRSRFAAARRLPAIQIGVDLSDVLLYSIALTAGGAVFAAHVTESGHAADLGWITALSGVLQLGSRWGLLTVLRRVRMQGVLNLSVGLQAAAFLMAALTTEVAVLAVSSALQGWSRGWFWTTSNARAAQVGNAGARVADVSLMSNAGSMLAPAILLVAAGFRGALVGTALVSLVAIRVNRVGDGVIDEKPRSRGAVDTLRTTVRYPGVGLSLLGGAMHVIVFTFVPALAVLGGLGENGVGVLLFVASLLGLVGVWMVRRGWLTYDGPATVVAGLAVVAALFLYDGLTTVWVLLAVALLAAVARGIFMTVGTVAAASRLPNEARTRAMVVTGTSRSIGIMVFPAAVGALQAGVALSVALPVMALGVTALSLLWEQRSKRRAAAIAVDTS